MFRKLFAGKGEFRSHVGPPLRNLYNELNSQQKAALTKQISRAPSGCEIVIYTNVKSAEVAKAMEQMPKQWLRELSLEKHAVAGLERLTNNYVFYIKGNFTNSQLEQLKAFFLQYQSEVNLRAPAGMRLELDIQSGCFSEQQLAELAS